jgi:mono/diheme cytochrome c family protein
VRGTGSEQGNQKKSAPSLRALFSLALVLAGLTGCTSLPPSKPLDQLSPQERAGYQVFAAQCSRCHHADSQRGLNGPGLEGLFRMRYLPSGGAATDDRVTDLIVHGRGMMPALGNQMSSQELQDLMAYLHTL